MDQNLQNGSNTGSANMNDLTDPIISSTPLITESDHKKVGPIITTLVIVLVIPLIVIVILLSGRSWFSTPSHKVRVAYSVVLESWLVLWFDRRRFFLCTIKVVQVKSFL